MAKQVKIKIRGLLWLSYFIASIVLLGSVGAFCIATPLYFLGLFFAPAERAAAAVMTSGIELLMQIQPWFRYKRTGETLLLVKPGGRLYVSNHRSHLDAFLLLSSIPGVRIFAKSALFKIPFLSFMMHRMKQLRAPSKKQEWNAAIEKVKDCLAAGDRVHLFPEMKRCEAGYPGVLEFALFPFHVAYQLKSPIVPIVFKNTDAFWPKGKIALGAGEVVGQPVSVKMQILSEVQSRDFGSAFELKNHVQNLISRELLIS